MPRGFHSCGGGRTLPAAVSKALLVRFDYNKYPVHAKAAGRPVEVHADVGRIVVRQGGEVVAEHARRFGREQVIYDPWHYVPVLARKPGALRNGAPFKDWALPPATERVRRKLGGNADGDRQVVGILTAIVSDGSDAVGSGVRRGARRRRGQPRCRAQHPDPAAPAAAGAMPAAAARRRTIWNALAWSNAVSLSFPVPPLIVGNNGPLGQQRNSLLLI